MDFKVTGKCFLKQESCLVIDETGNKLPVKSVMFWRMIPFVITEEGDINNFTGGKMETIFQADDQFFKFFEEQVKELQVERSQSIIKSIFRALMGRRWKTKSRQVTRKPPNQWQQDQPPLPLRLMPRLLQLRFRQHQNH